MDKKIPDVSGLLTTTVLNTKIIEVENKIHDVTGLVKKKNIMMLKYQTLKESISLLLL